MKTYSTSMAVPEQLADLAIAALSEAGFSARLAAEAARDEHPGHVVVTTVRDMDDEDGQAGRRNLEAAHRTLREAGVTFHDYGHGTTIAGGPGHRWVEMRGPGGDRLGIRALASTDAVERALGRAALAGSELEELTADLVHVLAGMHPVVGEVITHRQQHAALTRWVRDLVRLQFGDDPLVDEVAHWVKAVDRVRADRNALVHSTVTVVADLPPSQLERLSIGGPALARRQQPRPRPFDPEAWDDLIERMTRLIRDGRELHHRIVTATTDARRG